jgi:hypothetical protein
MFMYVHYYLAVARPSFAWAGALTFFITNALCKSSQTITRPPSTMEIDLCGRAELCPSTKTAREAAQPHQSELFDNTKLRAIQLSSPARAFR